MTSPTQEQRTALEREYGVYVAKEAIDINGARAFNPGDPVPVEHVTRGVVSQEQVVKANTKAGQALASGTADEKG